MSISNLPRKATLLICLVVVAAFMAGQAEAKDRERDAKKPTKVEVKKEQATDTKAAERTDTPAGSREAKPTQPSIAPATTPDRPIADPTVPQEATSKPAAGEQIKWQVLAGGGSINGMSTNYRLSGTVGQVAVGMGTSTNFKINQGFWQDFGTVVSPTCCVGETGDVNNSGDPANLTDLTLLVNQLFVTFVPVACPAEGNTNGDPACNLTLTDLTLLVNKLFVTFAPTAQCTDFDNSGC